MTCSFCENISVVFVLTEDYEHHPSLLALRQSSLEGCDLCRLIWASYSAEQTLYGKTSLAANNFSTIRVRFSSMSQVGGSFMKLFGSIDAQEMIKVNFGNSTNSSEAVDDLSLYLITSEDDPAAAYIQGRPLAEDPDSAPVYAKIASWIDICKSHPKCEWSVHDVMAGRLVCVESSNGSCQPYLIESAGRSYKYVALSYCWGSTKPLRTTEKNLDDHKRRIPMQTLPNTIQDAIIITRKLGIKFLWVDALCIIQDSKNAEDWQIESSKMDAIYKNAYLTIAAESSPDCNHGILHKRDAGILSPYKVPFFRPNGEDCGSVYICPSDTARASAAPLTDGCLNTRGWTYQERRLSRRVLSYYNDHIEFTCRSGSVTERLPLLFGPKFGDHFMGRIFPSQQSVTTYEAVFDAWYRGIEDYSRRSLTDPNDRLPAVSGLAHEAKSLVGGEYYAGLWERDLLVGLLWTTIPGQDTITAAPKRSPSWSWAAINRPVSYGGILNLSSKWRNSSYHRIMKLKAQTTPSTQDPMGRVSGGVLAVTCRIKEIRWSRSQHADKGLNSKHSQFSGPSAITASTVLAGQAAAQAAAKFRSFDPEIEMWDHIFNVGNPPSPIVLQPALSADVPSIVISWAEPHDEQVGRCAFDMETDRPERLWALSLTEDMGLVLEQISDEQELRRVGFYRSDDSRWLDDMPYVRITIV